MKKIILFVMALMLVFSIGNVFADEIVPAVPTVVAPAAPNTPAPVVAPPAATVISTATLPSGWDNLSIDAYWLYNLSTGQLSMMPGLTYNVWCAWDCLIKGNIGVVAPITNTIDLANVLAGPVIDVNLNNMIGKIPNFKWMTSKSIDFGIGTMLDIPDLTHKTFKECVFPGVHLRIITF